MIRLDFDGMINVQIFNMGDGTVRGFHHSEQRRIASICRCFDLSERVNDDLRVQSLNPWSEMLNRFKVGAAFRPLSPPWEMKPHFSAEEANHEH